MLVVSIYGSGTVIRGSFKIRSLSSLLVSMTHAPTLDEAMRNPLTVSPLPAYFSGFGFLSFLLVTVPELSVHAQRALSARSARFQIRHPR